MSETAAGVSLRGVTKIFADARGREVTAVDNVTFDAPRGALVTLLGPSGCGKTTILRMIGGFEHATRGGILIDGATMGLLPPNRRNTSMVFQSYALFPHLTIFNNVAYGLKLKKLPVDQIRTRVRKMLDVVGLAGLEDRGPSRLSGGQQQRVALARALVNEPSVLLFDEPLSNLDAKLRVQMRTEIRRIQQSLGITSVYVTHDQEEAMVISDIVVLLNAGRIEQIGSPRDIYERPASRFAADFFGRVNFVPVVVSAAAGDELTLDFAGASVTLNLPGHGLSAGRRAEVVLRPEAARIEPGGGIPARVTSAVYMGSVVEYALDASGAAITIHDPNPGARPLLNPGATVGLHLQPDAIHVLPAE